MSLGERIFTALGKICDKDTYKTGTGRLFEKRALGPH